MRVARRGQGALSHAGLMVSAVRSHAVQSAARRGYPSRQSRCSTSTRSVGVDRVEPQRSPKGAPKEPRLTYIWRTWLAHVAGARGWRTWLTTWLRSIALGRSMSSAT